MRPRRRRLSLSPLGEPRPGNRSWFVTPRSLAARVLAPRRAHVRRRLLARHQPVRMSLKAGRTRIRHARHRRSITKGDAQGHYGCQKKNERLRGSWRTQNKSASARPLRSSSHATATSSKRTLQFKRRSLVQLTKRLPRKHARSTTINFPQVLLEEVSDSS